MDHTNIASESQGNIHVQSKIDDFFDYFRLGTLLHRCGVRKRHGHGIRSLTQAIFTLPFVGQNFFRGIVINQELPFGKDAAYQLLKGTTYNWRRLLLCLRRRLFAFFDRLTSEDRKTFLIIDDSPYNRSRSKMFELLCRVWDHSTGRYLRGFRMLTVCWSNVASCLPLDFTLLFWIDAKKRLCDSQKTLDKRCCAHQLRKEATVKATEHLENMVKRIRSAGIFAHYLLMDRWFTMPATVTALAEHIDVIGMVKKSSKIFYR